MTNLIRALSLADLLRSNVTADRFNKVSRSRDLFFASGAEFLSLSLSYETYISRFVRDPLLLLFESLVGKGKGGLTRRDNRQRVTG